MLHLPLDSGWRRQCIPLALIVHNPEEFDVEKRRDATDVDQWGWSVGFYPGRHPGDGLRGAAETFEQCRADWMAAWARYLPGCTEEAFQEWRDQEEWTGGQYALWDADFNNLTVDLRCTCGMLVSAGDKPRAGCTSLTLPAGTDRLAR